MFEDFKKGDVIFFGNTDNISVFEHIALVEENIGEGVIVVSKAITFMKQPTPQGVKMVEMPNMGIFANINRVTNNINNMVINLNLCSVFGKVDDEEIKNRLSLVGTGLVLNETNAEKVNAILGDQKQTANKPDLKFV